MEIAYPVNNHNVINGHDELHRLPIVFEDLKNLCIRSDQDVFIFGADIAGKVTQMLLSNYDIKVSGYIDNNLNKCDKNINDVSVYHSTKLLDINNNSIILIASTYIADIIEQIEGLGFFNWAPISIIIESHKGYDFKSLLTGNLQENHTGGKFTKDFIDFTITNMVNSQEKYLDPNSLFIRSVDLILTEKCSLKCKDCANLMQFYENPQNIQEDELLSDLEDLCFIADEINEIRIIGGEPLMNKHFHTISQKAASYDNINKVVIYTNGTICPPEEKLKVLKNEKIFIFITTYGSFSRNERRLSDLLDQHGIQYNNQSAYGWTECGGIKRWERSPERNKEIFKKCCAKHFTTLTDGKLFRCPFSANAERLKAIPNAVNDYFSIKDVFRANKDIDKMKQKLKFFLQQKSVLSACDSCNGRTYGDPEITPGIQTNKPIQYLKYSR
jgi:organic radical activating enzyme